MPASKLTKLKTYGIDDGAKRGPLTVASVRLHPSERAVVAACGDRRLAVWHLDDAEVTAKNAASVPGKFACPHAAGWVRCVNFAPDGKRVVTGGSDRTLKVWAWENGKPADKPTAEVEAHAGWVEAVAVSPDGGRIVSGGTDTAVKVWDAANLKLLKTLAGHVGFVRDVAWLPDGSAFVSGAEDGKLLVWDAKTFELRRTITYGGANEQTGQHPALSGVHRLSVSHCGKLLAAAGGKGGTVLFDATSGAAVAGVKEDAQVCFSPAEHLLAAGSNVVRVVAFDADKLKPGKPDKSGKEPPPPPLAGKELAQVKLGDFSLGVRFSADGKLLALGRADGKVELWEVA